VVAHSELDALSGLSDIIDPAMKAPFISRVVLLLAIVGTIGCDRVTKHFAETALAGQPAQTFLAGAVWLGYVENTGGFLGLGATLPTAVRTAIFTVGSGLMLLAVAFVAWRMRARGWMAVGFALFLSGAASNWVDRLMNGSVIDFLNVGIGPVRTGVFNVADAAIMAGMVLVWWSDLRDLSRRSQHPGGRDVDVQQVP
jgi:signal peptidase II